MGDKPNSNPLYAHDSEAVVLGTLMKALENRRGAEEAVEFARLRDLRPDHFDLRQHRLIFEALAAVVERQAYQNVIRCALEQLEDPSLNLSEIEETLRARLAAIRAAARCRSARRPILADDDCRDGGRPQSNGSARG